MEMKNYIMMVTGRSCEEKKETAKLIARLLPNTELNIYEDIIEGKRKRDPSKAAVFLASVHDSLKNKKNNLSVAGFEKEILREAFYRTAYLWQANVLCLGYGSLCIKSEELLKNPSVSYLKYNDGGIQRVRINPETSYLVDSLEQILAPVEEERKSL